MLRVLSSRLRAAAVVAAVAGAGLAVPVVLAVPAFAATTGYGVTTTVPVGSKPFGVAVDPSTRTVYVANAGGRSVSVIDGATNTVTATVALGASPYAVAVDPSNRTVYAANYDGTVSVIDGATNTVTATVAVGLHPWAVAVDPSTRTVYVANAGGNSVSVISGATNTVIATVAVGAGPFGVAVDPSTRTVYVANHGGDSVSVINGATNTVTATVAVGEDPSAVAVDPSTHTVYVANYRGLLPRTDGRSNSVSVIDGATNRVTAGVTVGSNPSAVAVDPSTRTVYVANLSSDLVSVIDGATNTVTATVAVGSTPNGVAVDPSTHTVHAANLNGNSVSVINAGVAPTVTAVSPTSGVPGGGQGVTVTGTGFTYATAVKFGATAATSFTVNSATSITAVAPAGTGSVNVTVTTPFGTATLVNGYTYAKATPTLSTTPSAGTTAGGSISDTATLTGGVSPSGTATFTLYGPGDTTCSGTSLATRTVNVSGASAASGAVPVSRAGTYRWTATYSGDGTNNAVTSSCTDATVVTAAALNRIVVSPATSSVPAGGSTTYAAEGFDAYGNSLGDVTGDTTFTISGGGSCTGASCTSTAAGAHTVTGTDGAFTDTATLTVTAAPLNRIVISPATSSIAAGGSTTYAAEGFDQFGNSRGDVTGDTTFTISGGGWCTGASCTSTVAGAHTVTGTDGAFTDTATLTVTAAVLNRIVVSPATASVAAGGSQVFTAEGFDAYGNSLGDVTADTTFTISGGGTCTGATCTPSTTAGAYTVTGTDGSFTDSATLAVTAAALDRIVVSPRSVSVAAGGSQTYSAAGFDAYGNSLGDVTGDTVFTVDGGGSCTGAVCTPSTLAGSYTVTGTDGSVSDSAALAVTPGPVVRIGVGVVTARITAGTSRAYVVKAFDRFGNVTFVTADATFSATGSVRCTGAVCSSTTAQVATVTVRYGSHQVSTTLQVVPAALARIGVGESSATVAAGGVRSYVVTAFDRFGNVRGVVTGAATFAATGTVTCDGAVCGSTEAGVSTVTVEYQGLQVRTRLQVVPAALDHIRVSSRTSAITVGGSNAYVVNTYDEYDNPRGVVTDDSVLTAETGASCTGATCTADKPGQYTITATYEGLTATVTLRVVRSTTGGRAATD